MPNTEKYVSKIEVLNNTYEIKDAEARWLIENLPDPVTSVTAGNGLLGGEITSTGTIEVDFDEVQDKLTAGPHIIINTVAGDKVIDAIGYATEAYVVNTVNAAISDSISGSY